MTPLVFPSKHIHPSDLVIHGVSIRPAFLTHCFQLVVTYRAVFNDRDMPKNSHWGTSGVVPEKHLYPLPRRAPLKNEI